MVHDPSGLFGVFFASASLLDSLLSNLYIAIRVPPSLLHKPAWGHAKSRWTDSDISDFRNYVRTSAASNLLGCEYACSSAAVALLVEYAQAKGLPVVLVGLNRETFDSRQTIYKGTFASIVPMKIPVHELFNYNTTEKGQLPSAINLAESGDLMMKPSWVVGPVGPPYLPYGHTRIFLETRPTQTGPWVRYLAGSLNAQQPTEVGEFWRPLDLVANGTPSLRWWLDSVFGN